MACATPPQCACPTPVTTDVPGSPGQNGTNGNNAYSITQAQFTVPALGSIIAVSVDQSTWAGVNETVFIPGAGYFLVNSVPSSVLLNLLYINFAGNTASGQTIPPLTLVTPSGPVPGAAIPIIIAQGGTGATTQGGAQYNLGLGQGGVDTAVSGLTQNLTNASTVISGATCACPQTGLYLILVSATVDLQGATFGGSQTITLTAVDSSSSTTLATRIANTGTMTTQSYPSIEYSTPAVTAALNGGDVIQANIQISNTPSAGTAKVSSASVSLIPLAL
jgi:hypothetical protein